MRQCILHNPPVAGLPAPSGCRRIATNQLGLPSSLTEPDIPDGYWWSQSPAIYGQHVNWLYVETPSGSGNYQQYIILQFSAGAWADEAQLSYSELPAAGGTLVSPPGFETRETSEGGASEVSVDCDTGGMHGFSTEPGVFDLGNLISDAVGPFSSDVSMPTVGTYTLETFDDISGHNAAEGDAIHATISSGTVIARVVGIDGPNTLRVTDVVSTATGDVWSPGSQITFPYVNKIPIQLANPHELTEV